MHWGLSDPSKLTGSEAELAAAFKQTILSIRQRVEQLLTIDIDVNNKVALTAALEKLGAK